VAPSREDLQRTLDRLSRAVATSPADETAITCVERWRNVASTRGAAARPPAEDRELQVRVIEAGRPGAFRPEGLEPDELAGAIRHAMAQARGADLLPAPASLTPPPAPGPGRQDPSLLDPAILALDGEAGQGLLRELTGAGELARLAWGEVAMTLVTSRGLVRQLRATSAAFDVRCRRGPGAGSAAGAARSLAALDPAAILARARRRDSGDLAVGEWNPPRSVVLAPEAAAALLAALGTHLFSASAWEGETSFGNRHRGTSIAAAALSVFDDPTAAAGLRLPHGRTGAAASPAVLLAAGVLQRPAADPAAATRLGVAPTVPVWIGGPPQPNHLTLPAGDLAEAELLERAGEGIFVADIDGVELWDQGRLGSRLFLRGVRRIAGRELGEPLPDLTWDVGLVEALGTVLGIGSETVAREERNGLGAVSAPGLALAAAGTWQVFARDDRRAAVAASGAPQ
jgi:predicted Zn-dependent protease